MRTSPVRARVLCSAITLTFFFPGQAFTQTTNTNCSAWANQLNCTSTTQQDPNRQLQQNLQQLGAVLAQRRAEEAAKRAAWEAAATQEARHAADVARANYDATTDALIRFAADSAVPPTAPVNTDLKLDWALMQGVEEHSVIKGQNHSWYDRVRRWAVTDTPDGGRLVRMEDAVEGYYKKDIMSDYTTALRFDPASGTMVWAWDGRPRYPTVAPLYESALRTGTHAFATRMNGHGYDVNVPPGTVSQNMLDLVVASMPGPLPTTFRIWIVDAEGEVLPADFQITGQKMLDEPVGPAGGSCAGTEGKKTKMVFEEVQLTIGTSVTHYDLLAQAPHLAADPALVCRILEQQP